MTNPWTVEMFDCQKPIVTMCHLGALPGDPSFDAQAGLAAVIEWARKDLAALQNGGVNGVLFSNEFSLPYMTKVTMARIIGELSTTTWVAQHSDSASTIQNRRQPAGSRGRLQVRSPRQTRGCDGVGRGHARRHGSSRSVLRPSPVARCRSRAPHSAQRADREGSRECTRGMD